MKSPKTAEAAPADMAQKIAAQIHPPHGGSWIADDATGELTQVLPVDTAVEPPVETPIEEAR